MRGSLVVVGNGMAGARFVAELQRAAGDAFDLTVIGAEPYPAYNRILLSSLLAGDKTVEELALEDGANLPVRRGERVVAIDRAARQIRTDRGATISYDRLVLATGSNSVVLPIAGCNLPGVVAFRGVDDVTRMMAARESGDHAVVVGGGLLGLEAAEGLRRRGFKVTVVHLMPWLMERQLDAPAAELLRATLEARGIRFELDATTEAVLGENRVQGVRLEDGRELPADLVVMAVGIRPNVQVAAEAGLACNRGILVDDALRSSDPAIHAIGECAEHRGRVYGLVAPLWEQARVLARHLAGEVAGYEGSVVATSLKVTGVGIYSAGEIDLSEDDIVLTDAERGVYRKLNLRDGRVVGAVLVGDTADGGFFFDLIRSGRSVAEWRGSLAFGAAYAPAE